MSSSTAGTAARRASHLPIKVVLDGSLACSRRPTGVEFFAQSLLRELTQRRDDRIRWIVYLPPGGEMPGAHGTHVLVRRRPDVNTLIKHPWFVGQTWRDRPHVVYSFGHLLPRGCYGRPVITVHDLAFDEYPDCYPPGHPAEAHAQVAAAARRARRMVVPSEATKRGVTGGYGYPSDRIDVILEGCRPGFSPGPVSSLPEKVRQAGIAAPYFLCVGRLDRRKNIVLVIDAYRRLLQQGTPCGGLVIAGPEDTGSQAVRERIASGAVPGERIVTTGYLSDEELVNLTRGAAALVYPSLAEGFGLPLLEAMSCGTPTITSCVSSLPEVVGSAGLLIDPTDLQALCGAMQRVLCEPGLTTRLSQAGLVRARELTWEASAERLANALLRAAGVV